MRTCRQAPNVKFMNQYFEKCDFRDIFFSVSSRSWILCKIKLIKFFWNKISRDFSRVGLIKEIFSLGIKRYDDLWNQRQHQRERKWEGRQRNWGWIKSNIKFALEFEELYIQVPFKCFQRLKFAIFINRNRI